MSAWRVVLAAAAVPLWLGGLLLGAGMITIGTIGLLLSEENDHG